MNHILKITEENRALRAKLTETAETLQAFRAFLSSSKFTGTEADGSRKDWIATADVAKFLRETENSLSLSN
jgi:hypothetical protein